MKNLVLIIITLLIIGCKNNVEQEMAFSSTCDSISDYKSMFDEMEATVYLCYLNGKVHEKQIFVDSSDIFYMERNLDDYFIEKKEIKNSNVELSYAVWIDFPKEEKQRKHNFSYFLKNDQLIDSNYSHLKVSENNGIYKICLINENVDSVYVYKTEEFPNIFDVYKKDLILKIDSSINGQFCFEMNSRNFDKGYILTHEQTPLPDDSLKIWTTFQPFYFNKTLLERIKTLYNNGLKASGPFN